MGFYGNITNTSRTQFQFDRIYANRYEMDSNKAIDGIYAGRYVLIEYDKTANLDNFWRVEVHTSIVRDSVRYYAFNYNPSHNNIQQATTELTKDVAQASGFKVVFTADLKQDASSGYFMENPKFYLYRPDIELSGNNLAFYEEISDTATTNIPTYTINYNIDVRVYNPGRAYDSTVWQKVYIDGTEKYIMIAELNTVVPTFDISADAPSQSPLVPHFDTHSTDVYYKLHWQPTWGLRLRSADNQLGPEFTIDGVEIPDTQISYSEELEFPMRSDEVTTWKRNEYNSATGVSSSRYWNPAEQKWDKNPSDINAAIYYNKAGFSSEKISIKDEGQDRINLDPIGKSGNRYNDHVGLAGQTSAQIDIQELSMMLPSIGNSVAKMWNIVYGDFEQNNNSNIRNRDISWDSYNGLRMVKENQEGNGFTYEPNQVETLAGAINSVHDLMGMIIENPSGTALDSKYAESANENYIYYSDGKYWRKAIGYDYIPYEGTEITVDTEYSEITEPFIDFPANKFYYSNLSGNYTLEQNNYPTLNRIYYANAEDQNAEVFAPISLIPFTIIDEQEERYPLYFRNDNNVYTNEEFSPTSGVQYWTLNADYEVDMEVTVENFADKNYYINVNGSWERATEFVDGNTYYVKVKKLPNQNNVITKKPYQTRRYYLYRDDNDIVGGMIPDNLDPDKDLLSYLTICTDERFNPDYHYYTFTNDNGLYSIQEVALFAITNNHFYKRFEGGYGRCEDNTIPDVGVHYIEVGLIADEETFNDGDYYIYDEIEETYIRQYIWGPEITYYTTFKVEYYSFIIDGPFTNFYFRDKYYVTSDNLTYSLDRNGTMNEDIQYYNCAELATVDVDGVYYVGSTYYYKEDGEYLLDRNNIPTDNRIYYIKNNELYVLNDLNNLYDVGCKWNMNVSPIPEGVTLATRTAYPKFEELHNFARELNTIHGLILKTNYMLLYGDKYTRDQNTVQGCINVLNDIIAKFEVINPGEFMVVDDYGRIHSTPYTTAQTYDTFNFGKLQVDGDQKMISATEDRWIRLDIDTNSASPLITIEHEFTPQDNTTTISDKNNDIGDGNNTGNNDVLKFYTPIVDTTGHVVGHNIETVTMPYSYKFFSTTGNSTNSITDLDITQDTVSSDGAIVTGGIPVSASSTTASNTKDAMSIDPYNKWIQTKFTDDKLVIAHEVHGIKTDVLTTNLNDDGVVSTHTNDKITIQDITFDAAGHVKSNQAHTYTLPYSIKMVIPGTQSTAVTNPNVNTEVIVAENTQDTLNVQSTNKWIRMSATPSTDTLNIGHEVHEFESGNHSTKYGLESDKDITTLDANNIFEVPVFKFDEAGHITMAETHTIELPENFNTISILNTGSTNVGVNATSTTGEIAADTLTDTFTLDIGNRWIQMVTDITGDKVTLWHAPAGAQTNTTITSNTFNPNFGSSFDIPEVKYDEAGHISGTSKHTITLPKPSLNNFTATGASVLTGISMVQDTGAITQTNANVGTLLLTGYSLGTDANAIIATDSINAAFGKLQVQINTEVSERKNEITRLETLITNLTEKVASLETQLTELKTKVEEAHPSEEEEELVTP